MQALVHTPKVLIIDESTTVCLFMTRALENAGCHVITASDGWEGLKKAFEERPDCLVLEAILPGISGFEVCRKLRTSDSQQTLPIIMMSIKNTPLDHNWSFRQGANCYLPKPFTEETLVQTVRDVLPARFRFHITAKLMAVDPSSERQISLTLDKLIPCRSDDTEMMRSSNPLAGSFNISDKRARRLYAAIDGLKNVKDLCAVTNLDIQEASLALQILLAHQLIYLCQPAQRLENSSNSLNKLALPDLDKLIPCRSDDTEMMRSSNPLAGSFNISDKQARRLYAAINGLKNVKDLCAVTNLDIQEASLALQILLAHQLIYLCQPAQRLEESSALFLNGR